MPDVLTKERLLDELRLVGNPRCSPWASEKAREEILSHDEALRAQVEKAERERDEARRMYCRERSRACPNVIARETWPADADRLFPVKKGGK